MRPKVDRWGSDVSVEVRRAWTYAVVAVTALGVGYGLRAAFPPYLVVTTPVVIDEDLWRAVISGPPAAGAFAVLAAIIAFTPAILSTRVARQNAVREQWWNHALWALDLAGSDDQDNREVANDALQALLEEATPIEGKLIFRTIENLQRPVGVDMQQVTAENRKVGRVASWLEKFVSRTSTDAG